MMKKWIDITGIGYRLYLSSVVQNSDSGRELLQKIVDKLNKPWQLHNNQLILILNKDWYEK